MSDFTQDVYDIQNGINAVDSSFRALNSLLQTLRQFGQQFAPPPQQQALPQYTAPYSNQYQAPGTPDYRPLATAQINLRMQAGNNLLEDLLKGIPVESQQAAQRYKATVQQYMNTSFQYATGGQVRPEQMDSTYTGLLAFALTDPSYGQPLHRLAELVKISTTYDQQMLNQRIRNVFFPAPSGGATLPQPGYYQPAYPGYPYGPGSKVDTQTQPNLPHITPPIPESLGIALSSQPEASEGLGQGQNTKDAPPKFVEATPEAIEAYAAGLTAQASRLDNLTNAVWPLTTPGQKLSKPEGEQKDPADQPPSPSNNTIQVAAQPPSAGGPLMSAPPPHATQLTEPTTPTTSRPTTSSRQTAGTEALNERPPSIPSQQRGPTSNHPKGKDTIIAKTKAVSSDNGA